MHIISIVRDYLGMTQQALAKEAGITQADLCEIENKPPYGSIAKYQRLSNVLGIPVHTLVTNDFTQVPGSFFETRKAAAYLDAGTHIKAQIGRAGEEYALQMERERLEKICPSLAQLVIPYFKLRTNSPGYDILSYDDNARPILIEVKTTCQTPHSDFYLTRHEYEVAVRQTGKGVPYYIYRFSNWGTDAQRLDVLSFADLQNGQIRPSEYVCSMKPPAIEVSGITYYRRLRNLSQSDLAKQLGILQNHLCRYEKGERGCPVTIYQKLSEVLEAPIDDLLADYPAKVHEQ